MFCWAFAISTMLRQSLNTFFQKLDLEALGVEAFEEDVLKKLNGDDFHRQLRNELIMTPIPKHFSNEYIAESPLSQGHYLDMAFEKVNHVKKILLQSI